ncbi:unnamed protein product [Cylindrotheca closterium]|uniref:CCAAT-binding factor domain-containing protein n=1 Tax=Cylindrotheca closterium TaxID=2856 RepID=A0AAD2GBL7_9STRA|nr:unnamed protein product [Cylindrotheca closterium]
MKQNSKRRRRGRSGKEDNGGDNDDGHRSVLIKASEENASNWYDIGRELPDRDTTIASDPPQPYHQDNKKIVSKYRSLADSIFQKELHASNKSPFQSSDERWVENTMKKGTLKDRIAAISVTVSTDPIHKLTSLDGLLSMAGCAETGGKTNSRVAQLASEALEDLFANTLLPKDRKLISLDQRPLYLYEPSKDGKSSGKTLSPRILLLWALEESIKSKYQVFLGKYLVRTLKEGLEIHKIAALKSASALLCTIPEGEHQLLAMIVNKLGDPGKKTSASAGHQLRMILQKHPNMQEVIAREVQQLAHRSHLSARALYNCVVFLNQLKLEKSDETSNLPASLIRTYFRLFEVAVRDKDPGRKDCDEKGMNSRLLSALLSGVNRARPYLPQKNQAMEAHVDSLYRVVHAATPSASTQALMLLYHLVIGARSDDSKTEAPNADGARRNRFYRALYASLSKLSHISHGKHSTMFFNLLYRAMKSDDDDSRVNACAKRLMSTALHANAATVAGSVFLLNEIAMSKPSLRVCLETVPIGRNCLLVLDDSKREPSSALVASNNGNAETRETGQSVGETMSPPLWELCLVSQHFHPSVSKFGSTIGDISYAGDPLRDFGLAPFLDKFSYRNPKSNKKVSDRYDRRRSIAERRSGMKLQIQSRLELPVNDPQFLEQEGVSEQDEFFLKFFSERARRDEIKGIKRQLESSETDDEEDPVEETGNVDLSTKSFAELEQAWETDSEEEAFADSLAEQLIESVADSNGNFDDEDPGMSDWSDFDGEQGQAASVNSSDDDDFLDIVSDSDSDASMRNRLDSSIVFVDAEEYENQYANSEHVSRKKRKTKVTN